LGVRFRGFDGLKDSQKISVVVVSSSVGKNPRELSYSFVFDEVYRLVQNRISVYVITSKTEKESLSYGIHFSGIEKKIDPQAINLTLKNITRYPLISLLRKPQSFYYENLYARYIIRTADKNSVDLIHAHFAYSEGFASSLAKSLIKKPLIITCHGYDINIVPEVGYGIRLSKRYDALVRIALRKADAIICVSSRLMEEVLKLGINPQKTFVIFNAVDLELFRPPTKRELDDMKEVRNQFGVDEDDFLIFNARHLRPVYGLEYLVSAAKLVTDRIKKAKFLIAGEGELKEKLNTLIHHLRVEKNVKLIGSVPRALMPKLMRAASLYVNTSLCDGMSPSMLEAFASGVPIVSFDVGGANDIIDDGVNGFLVPPKDYKTLAAKIIYLLENPDLLRNFSANARKKAEERFDANKRICRIIDVYRKTMGDSS
jgi:glycosyltransferase involved in cell wall biosynthesis